MLFPATHFLFPRALFSILDIIYGQAIRRGSMHKRAKYGCSSINSYPMVHIVHLVKLLPPALYMKSCQASCMACFYTDLLSFLWRRKKIRLILLKSQDIHPDFTYVNIRIKSSSLGFIWHFFSSTPQSSSLNII